MSSIITRIRRYLGLELTETQKRILQQLRENPNAHLIEVGNRGGLRISDPSKMVFTAGTNVVRNLTRIRANISNVDELTTSEQCGCYSCQSLFNPSDVVRPDEHSVTLLCPNCGDACVIVFNKREIDRENTLKQLNEYKKKYEMKEKRANEVIVKENLIDNKRIYFVEVPDSLSDKELNDVFEQIKGKYKTQ